MTKCGLELCLYRVERAERANRVERGVEGRRTLLNSKINPKTFHFRQHEP